MLHGRGLTKDIRAECGDSHPTRHVAPGFRHSPSKTGVTPLWLHPGYDHEPAMTQHSARARLDEALARIDDPAGEGSRACLTVYRQGALVAGEAGDARRRAGLSLGPLDGAILTIKDLFDVAGEPTRAGSKVLAAPPPAPAD